MNISKLEKIKNIMSFILNKTYYIGASLVIVALMFRFMDWKGSEVMLIIGLFMEALIFFLGAFNNDEIDFKKEKNSSVNNIEEEIIPKNVFDKCGINLSKYYSEINSDMKKINFKIQSFAMMQKLQNAFAEQNFMNSQNKPLFYNFSNMSDEMENISKKNKNKNSTNKKDRNKKEEKNILQNENINVKRKRGRPRKNFNI